MEPITLIIGSGPCAFHISENLQAKGIEVIIAVKDDNIFDIAGLNAGKAEILLNTRILACKGFVGDFDVSMDVNGEKTTRSVSSVIIAEEDARNPEFSEFGLASSPGVVTLSQLMKSNDLDKRLADAKTLVFLTGLTHEGNHVVAEDIMKTCLRLENNFDIETYVLTRNLKVGGNGLERLFRETKKSGTVYVKFTETLPELKQDHEGNVTVSFLDEVTQENFRLTPDIIVVDEKISPSDYFQNLAEIFSVDLDRPGFLQSDNVHRLGVFTNRRGIMVAGPSRAVLSHAEQMTDAANSVIATLELFEGGSDEETIKAEIHPGKCVRCLTCIRICPHKAVRLNDRVSVVPEACEGCGICTAECPKNAINIIGLESSALLPSLNQYEAKGDSVEYIPIITAFCCGRSAARAWDLSSNMSLELPQGLTVIEIPCGGSISVDHVYSAFKGGADGVLVLTCHEGNCNSEKGNAYANRRIESIAGMLAQIGFEEERLIIGSLASNMAREFADITTGFEGRLKSLGPSRIKKT